MQELREAQGTVGTQKWFLIQAGLTGSSCQKEGCYIVRSPEEQVQAIWWDVGDREFLWTLVISASQLDSV